MNPKDERSTLLSTYHVPRHETSPFLSQVYNPPLKRGLTELKGVKADLKSCKS